MSDLQFKITGDAKDLVKATKEAEKSLQDVGKSAKNVTTDLGSMSSGISAVAKSAVALTAVFASFAGLKSIAEKADELSSIRARMKMVTDSSSELNAVWGNLFRQAQANGVEFGAQADLYLGIARAAKEAGVGQQTMLDMTDAVSKTMKISGASASEAAGALRQFGQAMSKGVLNGDELVSILENAPELATQLAKGMGISRGELKKMGEEGKITSAKIVEAITKQKEEIDKLADGMPKTFGEATTKMANSGKMLIGAFEDITGATETTAGMFSDLADYISSKEFVESFIEWIIRFKEFVGDVFGPVIFGAIELSKMLFGGIKILAKPVISIFEDGLPAVIQKFASIARLKFMEAKQWMNEMVNGFLAGLSTMLNAVGLVSDEVNKAKQKAYAENTQKHINDTKQAQEAADKAFIDGANRRANVQKKVDDAIAARRKKIADEDIKLSKSMGSFKAPPEKEKKVSGGAGKKQRSEKSSAVQEAASEARLVKDQMDRMLRENESAYDQQLITFTEYLNKKRKLQLESIDFEIEALRKADSIKNREQITLLTRKRMDITGDFIGKLEEAEKKSRDILSRIENTKSRTDEAVKLGLMSQSEAENEVQEIRGKSVKQLEDIIKNMEDLIKVSNDPRLVEALKKTKIELEKVKKETVKVVESLRSISETNVSNFFEELITGSASLGDAMRNLAISFAKAIARMIADAFALNAVKYIFTALGFGPPATGAKSGGSVSATGRSLSIGENVAYEAFGGVRMGGLSLPKINSFDQSYGSSKQTESVVNITQNNQFPTVDTSGIKPEELIKMVKSVSVGAVSEAMQNATRTGGWMHRNRIG